MEGHTPQNHTKRIKNCSINQSFNQLKYYVMVIQCKNEIIRYIMEMCREKCMQMHTFSDSIRQKIAQFGPK